MQQVNMIRQVGTETLQEKVYGSLKDLIMRNVFMPGRRLSADALATELGVSPTPVRDALTRLCADGLVERSRNKTAVVAEITPEHVQEVYQARMLVEVHVVGLAAGGLSSNPDAEDRLHKLRQEAIEILEEVDDTPEIAFRLERSLDIDLRLAEIVSEALGKTLLANLFAIIGKHSLRIRSFAEAVPNPSKNEIMHIVAKEHLEIIEAMLDGDTDRIEEAVQRHLANAEERTIQTCQKLLGGSC